MKSLCPSELMVVFSYINANSLHFQIFWKLLMADIYVLNLSYKKHSIKFFSFSLKYLINCFSLSFIKEDKLNK